MDLDGLFFSEKKKEYNEETYNCVVEAVEKLETIGDRPLMMLGKIQSGKTKSFIGVMALAFDNGYDFVVVLTKNSNALAKQTTTRMKQEFKNFRDDDEIEIFDIMCIPPGLTKFQLDKKLVIVVKKEKTNIPKLFEFIEDYGIGINKKCLIIDDEADFCSIGYEKNKSAEIFDLKKIASQINDLRLNLTCKFIQVTATPYSLYLQPEEIKLGGYEEIKPVKPASTVLVPYGDEYIGGEYYFDEEKYPLGKYLYHSIDENELEIIKKDDRRKFKEEEILTSPKIQGIRTAIINFIIGGCIRIYQNGGRPKGKKNKFSFIIHTEISKASHARQSNIIYELISQLEEACESNSELLNQYIEEGYKNLGESVESYGFNMPSEDELKAFVKKAILDGWLNKTIVNSENDINALLDEDGQLQLRTPLNIFIGGQILDRGITVSNLIGFYYGRNPKKMQQDTVLQHSRMFGYRSKKDLAVTRFYTTIDLYERMKKVNEFDSKLREDFEEGKLEDGVIFISKDNEGKIIPCSPEKIRISDTQVIKPWKTATPIGFQTGYKTYIKKDIEKIDGIIKEYNKGELKGKFKIPKNRAIEIIKLVYKTLEIESKCCLTEDGFISLINYVTKGSLNVYSATGRNISRERKKGYKRYSDMPYNKDRDLRQAREMAINEPAIMMMRQEGRENLGWKGAEFWWPVLVFPKNISTAVYSNDLDS